MRIIIITQDDPFFLAQNLDYLFSHLPDYAEIIGCTVNTASPYGKKESFIQKTVKTLQIFGPVFFIRYTLKFVHAKFSGDKKVLNILNKYNIQRIPLTKGINNEESLDILRKMKPDLLISILGNEIFRKPLIDLAPKGCLNLHTALLPKYRGLMPSFWVLKNSEKETGVSVFYVDEGIDSGPILVQKRFEIKNMSQDELIKRTKVLGMDAIIEAIEKINRGDIDTIENNDDEKTYYNFPTRNDVIEFKNAGARFF